MLKLVGLISAAAAVAIVGVVGIGLNRSNTNDVTAFQLVEILKKAKEREQNSGLDAMMRTLKSCLPVEYRPAADNDKALKLYSYTAMIGIGGEANGLSKDQIAALIKPISDQAMSKDWLENDTRDVMMLARGMQSAEVTKQCWYRAVSDDLGMHK